MAYTRVYILANELGVQSTAIVKKCQDEGVTEVKNHMTAIGPGLAATIKEWFSEGAHTTTEEVAEKVDLQKVRVRRRVKPKVEEPAAAAPQAPPVQAIGEEVKTEAAGGTAVITEEQGEKKIEPEIKAPEVIEAAPEVKAAAEEKPAAAEPVVVQPAAEAPAATVVKPSLPKYAAPKPVAPKPIKPAGPMLKKPSPPKLTGPTVVRVEKPEPVIQPRSKPRLRYDEPLTQPLISGELEDELATSKDGKKTIGHKDRTHGRRSRESQEEVPKKAKYLTIRRQRDIEERRARLDAAGGERLRLRPLRKIATKADRLAPAAARPTKATVTEPVTIKDLSAALAVKAPEIISKLLEQGIMATANETISNEVAELAAIELGCELTIVQKTTLEDKIRLEFEQRERNNLVKRPVVATMLGHVDHGKTSLLDKIRSTNVTASEAGGITQHIGAYQVKVGEGRVTFLDTPGHEAFTAMRARGANMTDVVVLVVAADDGLMPQTIEAIAHSKAAGVPVIVALNKIDLPGIDINRIYAQLAEHVLVPSEWGGNTDVVKTSAITGVGINDLLEHIDYLRDVQDLKSDETIPATGWIVEAKISSQRGAVATLLIKEGKLNKGDAILAGSTYGRVKTIKDSFGRSIKTATSSMPVEITGLNGIPQAGDRFYNLGEDFEKAKAAAEENLSSSREKTLFKKSHVTLENLFKEIEAGNIKELNVILRADVQGSVDVLMKYLTELSTEEVKIKILHSATGGITEGDVVLAEASNAIIIGFSVVADEQVRKIAEAKGVDIRLYTIIYRITEDLKKSMAGLLEPREEEKSLGKAQVREIFKVSKVGTIAGCHVTEGVARKNARVRLIRDNIIIRDNMSIESLKHFKDDAREVKSGMECGIKIANYDDIKVGDILDFYEIVEVARTL